MCYRLECPANRYVFKSRLNCLESTAGSLRQSGSEFQTVGAAVVVVFHAVKHYHTDMFTPCLNISLSNVLPGFESSFLNIYVLPRGVPRQPSTEQVNIRRLCYNFAYVRYKTETTNRIRLKDE